MKKLIDVLVNPQILLDLSLSDLSFILDEARYFNMLPQLKYLCEKNAIWFLLPLKFQQHLNSSSLFYRTQCSKLEEERKEIKKVLQPLKIGMDVP